MSRAGTKNWLPYLAVALAAAVALVVTAQHLGWRNLFLTPDQRGRILLDRNQPAAAAEAFRDPLWRGTALYRAGDFKAAAQAFAASDTADSAYNQGNALVMLGQYEEAVKRYDRALALHPGWTDAVTNREIARIRGERKKAEGGVNDDTESKPDEIVFDKTKKGGEDTTLQEPGQPMSDEAVRALWLKQVQTRPADFLRVKFSYQLQSAAERNSP
ncbi:MULTISPECIES: tetratricopeptide repeat protein [unclassified Beijerinckia]|uniref:tetratricopeptide repeat protein n=1 Tax=unclassified Beijerinckia TaxID=2638183 RepID=UPI00089BF2EE|nr:MULTISPECIES: tetratricopeptide repeat protein [unclassified Beijerinckia]MDH7799854.1 Ca-activated chloride channel family protein [Beijerinckia sp. GAS462]SED39917.1 Ca-activated chloride channel family protein [Beijerinckia sp. 28-YEA-48]